MLIYLRELARTVNKHEDFVQRCNNFNQQYPHAKSSLLTRPYYTKFLRLHGSELKLTKVAY